MARPLVSATAAAIVLGLVVLIPRPAFADSTVRSVQFFFTPQAGYSSACLSCGWHSECIWPYPWGTGLDFPASCSGGQSVYLRNFGFLWRQWDTTYVGYAAAYEEPGTTCRTVTAAVRDTAANLLGEMWYVHTYRTYPAIIWLYANENGYKNEQPVARMVDADNPTCPGWVDGYWPIHLHERHENYASTFLLRDHGNCEGDVRYPCGPQAPPYDTYDPQDWENDWARVLCIADTDCDSWKDSAENIIGTDPLDNCSNNPSHAAWPLDINNDTAVTVVGDVLAYSGNIGASVSSNPSVLQRLDLNADGVITAVGDVLMYAGRIGESCANP